MSPLHRPCAPAATTSKGCTHLARGTLQGLEFGRYSIDYHFLRNALFVERRMGEVRARRHTPQYALAIMERYSDEMEELRAAVLDGKGQAARK